MIGRIVGRRSARIAATLLLADLLAACSARSSSPAAEAAAAGDPSGLSAAPSDVLVAGTVWPAETARQIAPYYVLTPIEAGQTSVVPAAGPPARTAQTFVVLGDSLSVWAFSAHGTTPASGHAWPSLLAAQAPDLKLVFNAGVPGNNTTQMVARYRRDVQAHHPDVLFVMGGTNDIGERYCTCTVINNVRLIVKAAKSNGITVVLISIPPNNTSSMRTPIRKVNAALAALAMTEGVAFVDVYSALVGARGHLASGYAARDGLHLTALGQSVLASTLYKSLASLGLVQSPDEDLAAPALRLSSTGGR